MWKFWNRIDNTVSIPSRTLHTIGQGGIDAINTFNGLPKDITSVVLNTKNKIANLFSKDLKRYHYIWNMPVAVWVWFAWAVEAVTKPIVNGLRNTWKTAVNFVSNARKSTLWSLFSTKPVSDISFNTIKTKKRTFKLDTTNGLLNRDNLRTEGWWFLTPAKKKARLEKKKAKIEKLISKL